MEIEKFNLYTLEPNTCSVKPNIVEIYRYFNYLGYGAVLTENTFETFWLNGNFVYPSYDKDLIDCLIKFFTNPETAPEGETHEKGVRKVYDLFIDAAYILEKITAYKFGNIINENNHALLTRLTLNFLKHGATTGYFYFKNHYVKITADKTCLMWYENLSNHVLSDKIIDKQIDLITDLPMYKTVGKRGAQFHDFLQKICLTPFVEDTHKTSDVMCEVDGLPHVVDSEKYHYLTCLIGYLLHDKRIKGATDFCVIFCDDDSGGSGKGLLGQALAQLTLVAEVDGKKKRTEFDQINLNKYTRVKIYNDIPKNFDFEAVYNEVTDAGVVRHTYTDPVSVPYDEMWKVLILTNYIVKSSAGHSKRRQKVFELFPFFNDKNRVRDYYKHSFFSADWDENDWHYFYNLMFQCVQNWLACNYKLEYSNTDYTNRLIFESYSPEFIEYVEGLRSPDGWHDTGDLFSGFIRHINALIVANKPVDSYIREHLINSSNQFGRKLRSYCTDKGYGFAKTKDRSKVRIVKPGQVEMKQGTLRFELNNPDQLNLLPQ